eukprot:symbB.v1.2.009972.t1/scaffold623.1/size335370/15
MASPAMRWDVAAAQHTTARGTAAGLVGLSGACVARGRRGALSESLCTACKSGEAAAGRHQHQVMPVLIGVRWM